MRREKNILPTRLLGKKILDDQKSPNPPTPPPQELNGRLLRVRLNNKVFLALFLRSLCSAWSILHFE